jgi:hypothetical protein
MLIRCQLDLIGSMDGRLQSWKVRTMKVNQYKFYDKDNYRNASAHKAFQ